MNGFELNMSKAKFYQERKSTLFVMEKFLEGIKRPIQFMWRGRNKKSIARSRAANPVL